MKLAKRFLFFTATLATINLAAQSSITLTMGVNDASWGSTDPVVGEHTVTSGEAITITATPEAGYQFSKWNGGGNVVIADESSATTSATLSKNASVTAIFVADPGDTVVLTMAVNDASWGSTDPAVGDHTINAGEAVTITATPVIGYQFSKWTAGNNVVITDESSATTSATLSKNGSITAVFVVAPKDVSLVVAVSPDAAGATTPEVGTYTYQSGDKFSINATANDGYEFYGWSASGGVSVQSPTNAATSATIIENGGLTAVFVPDTMEDLEIGLVNIKTTNAAANKDKIILNKGIIPAGFPTLTADSVVTVVVGGYSTRCTDFIVDDAKGKYYTKFEEDDGAKIQLKFDTGKGLWTFKGTKLDAFDDLNFNVDPNTFKTEVMIYLNVEGGGNYGRTFETDENTTWKWKGEEDLTESLNIEKAVGKYKTNTVIDPLGKKDKFSINKGTLGDFTPEKSMFADAEVTIRIDNLAYESAFTLEQANPDKEVYKAKVDTGTGLVKMMLKQVDNNYSLKLKINKADCSTIKGPDINVRLSIGTVYRGNFKISSSQKTTLKYKAP